VVELSNEEAELPHDTIKKVQKGLETLKKKAEKQKSISSETFLNSVEDLNNNLSSLSNLFQEAAKDIKEEEEVAVGLKEKMNTLESENRKIAQGILAIADMIKELEEKIERPKIGPPIFMKGKKLIPPRRMTPGPMPPRMPGAMPKKKPMMPPGGMPYMMAPGPMPPRMPGMPPRPMPAKKPMMAPGPMPPRMPGAAMPPPIPKEMPTPKPVPPMPPGRMPPFGMPSMEERPMAPRPTEPSMPEMPAGELPPLPTTAKKKGFFARLFGR